MTILLYRHKGDPAAIGFPCDPLLCFNPDDLYPSASTCAIELTLPTQYSDYKVSGTHTMYMIHYLLKCALSIFLINHKLYIISIHDQLLQLSFISIYNDLVIKFDLFTVDIHILV